MDDGTTFVTLLHVVSLVSILMHGEREVQEKKANLRPYEPQIRRGYGIVVLMLHV